MPPPTSRRPRCADDAVEEAGRGRGRGGRRPSARRRGPGCRRRGPTTSCSARCCSGSASSTGCRSRRARPPRAARWCTRCWSGSSTRRPPSGRSRPRTRCCPASGPRCSSGPPRSASCSRRRRSSPRGWAAPGAAGHLLHARGPEPAGAPGAGAARVHRARQGGPQLRGIVDRLDVAPNGAVRVVDYKTGRSPRAGYEGAALFQMRFYAYVLWRTRGVLPSGCSSCTSATARSSGTSRRRRRWRPSRRGCGRSGAASRTRPGPATGGRARSKLCDWCSLKALCPAFGGTPPEIPEGAVERAIGVVPAA